jgi:predicted nucleic-acid-binding protein
MMSGPCSLDTSAVLRLLIGQPVDQHQRAAQFLAERLAAGDLVHVGDLVLAEAYFALQHHYAMPKADALTVLALFAQHSGVCLAATAQTVLATPQLASTKPGFVDRLIHGASQFAGHTLVTFEKAAKKLPDTVVL